MYYKYIKFHSIRQTSNYVIDHKKQILLENSPVLENIWYMICRVTFWKPRCQMTINNQTLTFSKQFIQGLQRTLPVKIMNLYKRQDKDTNAF